MRILNRLGGIELSQAYAMHQGDLARRRPTSSPRAASSSSRGPSSAGWTRSRPTKIFDLIEFFGGYGFNKSHIDRLRPGRLPDGLPQGPLPDRVHGRPALLGDGRRRARQVLRRAHRRLPADGDRGPAARTSTRATSTFRVAERGEDPLRPGGDQGGRRQGGRGDRRGPRGRAGRSAASTTSSSGCRARGRRPGVRRDADQGRGVRLPRGPSGASCWPSCPAPSRPARPSRTTASAASAACSTIFEPSRRRQRPRQRQRQRPRRALEPARRPRAARRRAARPGRRRRSASTCRATR